MTRTVIILGAGISKAAAGKKSLRNRPPLDADFFEVAQATKVPQYKNVSEVLNQMFGDYSSEIKKSLERATTSLYLKAIDQQSSRDHRSGFLSHLTLLNTVLAKTTNQIKVSPGSLIYRFLLSELSKVNNTPENLSIITFNYDLLIEKTLNEIAKNNSSDFFQFPQCYRLSQTVESTPSISGIPEFQRSIPEIQGVATLKLHGSMNWLSKHTSETPKPDTLFNTHRRLYVANAIDIGTDMTWKPQKRTQYIRPIIVPPISGKRSMMHSAIPPLWNIAAEKLQEADRIVVVGYSCPPLDIEARMLLSENLRKNNSKKLYVVDPNGESAARFIDLCGVDHATIYSSLKAWVKDGQAA